jgi:DNA-binding response OmpR family regulator
MASGTFRRVDRILFADADSAARLAYHAVATSDGFDVELASDGYEAMALTTLVRPDIVVLDTRLAGHDAFEITRGLRASPLTRTIPIIVVTADDGLLMENAIRTSGCEGHLTKPFSANALLRLVRVLLIGSRGTIGGVAADARRSPREAS